ncbi:MAG: imidazole glycerol phosphate synthase subunit HisH [Atopobiaceae bacterium]|nr:imidazole glycerol phosphate synthase subunit HisH [Atopobiaceae bacterium]MDO4403739.1 imidazole glycerol phosphate synthase subunit HisH [Atopobiaceae bacterium]
MSHEIVVVDYHKGNLLSVARSMSAVGAEVVISDDPRTIAEARGIILPGVGSFEDAMSYLRSSGEADAIVRSVRSGVPFLGICLGLHLLFDRGSEHTTSAWGNGWVPGLGLLSGSVTILESSRLKVPHVGWDQLHLTEQGRQCPLFVDVPEGSNVYFTHSYALADDVDPGVVCTRTHYTRSFASSVWQDNMFGVQFHPEKSSATGLRILSNFLRYVRG